MNESASHMQVLQFVWRYAKKHHWVVVLIFILKVGAIGLHLFQPYFTKAAVDALSSSDLTQAQSYYLALQMVLYGLLVGVGAFTLMEGATIVLARIEARIIQEIVQDVFAHVQRLSTKFHLNTFAGATARKITRGSDGVEQMIDRLWFDIIPLILFVTGLTAALSLLSKTLGLLVCIGMIVYSIISVILNLIMFRYFRITDKQDTKITANLVDTLGANALVKAFVTHSRENDRNAELVSEWRNRALISWYIATGFSWMQTISLLVLELAVITYALKLWLDGTFTTGTFVMMNFYVGLMWGYMRQIGNNIRDYLRGISNAEEMVALSALPLEIEDKAHATTLNISGGAIALHAVEFHYDAYHESLFTDLSLSIGAKEKIALVGHSGSGKSTIIKLLMRLYDVTGGSITIDNQNISDVTQSSLRRATTLVPQDPVLFHRSIGENIAYGKPDATAAEIQRAARLAHAHEFIRELPQGYDTLVGERGVKLSGGERQRVAIARAILADKPILILDEATSSLDSVSENYIQEALEHLVRDRTAIIIAHRLSTVRSCDRIAVLDKGKLIACAPHEELLKTCPLYKEMVELQSHGMLAE